MASRQNAGRPREARRHHKNSAGLRTDRPIHRRGSRGGSMIKRNDDRILFPADGITKRDVIDYYDRIGPVMLPHIENRPLMLQRCPEGIQAECFYQKNVASYFPKSVTRVTVQKEGGHVTHAVVNS